MHDNTTQRIYTTAVQLPALISYNTARDVLARDISYIVM